MSFLQKDYSIKDTKTEYHRRNGKVSQLALAVSLFSSNGFKRPGVKDNLYYYLEMFHNFRRNNIFVNGF